MGARSASIESDVRIARKCEMSGIESEEGGFWDNLRP
jgi:hypothetical protein